MTSLSVSYWKGPAKACGIALAIDLAVYLILHHFG
jgi:hypothetical protein